MSRRSAPLTTKLRDVLDIVGGLTEQLTGWPSR
jgi:hypothetical protein